MIGFDIGGTKCSVVIGEINNDKPIIVNKKTIKTNHNVSPFAVIDELCSLAETMTTDFSKIGISCGGPLDSEKGIIMSPPNLPGWDDFRIVEYLEKKYNGIVKIQNDANACALAEWKYGAGRGVKNMVFLTFGTGLGAGLILNGQLYSGTNDMAGEVGHIRLSEHGPIGFGKGGSFEGFCSGGGIAQIGRTIAIEKLQMGETVSFCKTFSELGCIDAKLIAQYAADGDEDAIKVYNICAEKLGFGLSIIIDILNPQRIVIGSVFQRSEVLLRKKMEEIIEKEALYHAAKACEILPAELGDAIGDYAALAVADENS